MKKLLTLMLAAGFMFGFVACGGNQASEDASTEDATEMVEEAAEDTEEAVEEVTDEAEEAVEEVEEEMEEADSTASE